VFLVKPPIFNDRYIVNVQFIQNIVGRFDSSSQD
jgi:hypothetical protein